MDTITVMMGASTVPDHAASVARQPSKGQYGVKTLQGLQQLILL